MREALGRFDGSRESAEIVERFELPDALPPAVEDAATTFRQQVEGLRQARADLKQAEGGFLEAIRADIDQEAEALVAGGKPPKEQAEEAAREKAEEARRHVAVAEVATDKAGDRLLEVIEEVRSEWIADLRDQAEAASASFAAAVAEAGKALDALSWALAPVAWLEAFNAKAAEIGAGDGGLDRMKFRPDLPEPVAEAFTGLATLNGAVQATRRHVEKAAA